MTWSLTAVLKIELRIEYLQYWIVHAEAPLACILVIHSRTCSGRMSAIRMGPNSGMMCASR